MRKEAGVTRCLLAFTLAVSAFPAAAALCTPDLVPAATLLAPYFETCPGACLRDTRVVVLNSGSASRLARVTVWSNAAVPVLTFDLYLQGFAQQQFMLRDFLTSGTLPVSGPGVSEPGLQAEAEQSFPDCNPGNDPANGSPVYGAGALDATERAALVAALGGQPDPVSGLCSALPRTDQILTGYLTIDAVDRCNAPRAGQAGFAEALAPDNVLLGRVDVFDFSQDFQYSLPAVAVEADAGGQLAGKHTFYRFDGVSADDREPLPTSYVYTGHEGTVYGATHHVLVWRGVGTVQAPFACASAPPWYPLDFNRNGFGSSGRIVIDDQGVPRRLYVQRQASLAAQPPFEAIAALDDDDPPTGALYFNLQHRTPLPGQVSEGQAWVGAMKTSQGRYRSIEAAASLDSSCAGPGFDNLSPGLAPPLPPTP
jgi:hypothetical protein